MARRRYGAPVAIDLGEHDDLDRHHHDDPDLGDFTEDVGVSDLLVGLAVGLLAAGGAKYLANTQNAPDTVKSASPALGGLAAGLVLWKARGDRSGAGNFVGAAAAGVVIAAAQLLAKYGPPQLASAFSSFGIPVSLPLPLQGYRGLVVEDAQAESQQGLQPGYSGLIVEDSPSAYRGYADRPGMGALAAASLDPDEDYSEVTRLAALGSYQELDVEGQG
jgi:hypothetical protein